MTKCTMRKYNQQSLSMSNHRIPSLIEYSGCERYNVFFSTHYIIIYKMYSNIFQHSLIINFCANFYYTYTCNRSLNSSLN